MENIKKIKIILSEQDLTDIENNINSGYSIFRLKADEYKIILEFKIEKRQVNLVVEVTYNFKSEIININETFYGTVNTFSIFDKVFCLNTNSDTIKILMKIESSDNLKYNLSASLFNSDNICVCGNINLYNHILYTDFRNDLELITLCYKYSSFCFRILEKKSITEAMELLDKGLYKIETSFQEKLEYYGYEPKAEIDEIWDINIADKITKKTKTKNEIKNHIVLLTQCLFDSGKYSALKESLTEKITDEVLKYKELLC